MADTIGDKTRGIGTNKNSSQNISHASSSTSSNLSGHCPGTANGALIGNKFTSCSSGLDKKQVKVLYAKRGPRKRKTFSDGELFIHGDGRVVLVDGETRQKISSSRMPRTALLKFASGLSVEIGGFEIDLNDDQKEFKLAGLQVANSNAADDVQQKKLLLATRKRPLANSNGQVVSKSMSSKSIKSPSTIAGDANRIPVLQALQSRQQQAKFVRVRPHSISDPLAEEHVASDAGLKTLLRRLQKHQIEAVRFLWRCAIGLPRSSTLESSSNGTPGGDHSHRCNHARPTGCILADSMGLGKTLSTIAFLYCCVHYRLARKAVVVVPSSLLQNWKNEFIKWLRFLLSPVAHRPDRQVLVAASGTTNSSGTGKPQQRKKKGGKYKKTGKGEDDQDEEDRKSSKTCVVSNAAAVVKEFMAFKAPVLIISYENYRKYADMLNVVEAPCSTTISRSGPPTMNSVDLIICDEGHRLKSTSGSKTMEALLGSPAKSRVLLTGTPVQNDLGELHAMVSFVAPGLLGASLGEFRRNYGDAIEAGRDRGASSDAKRAGKTANRALSTLLKGVILRRSASVLRHALPPRRDFVVFCRLGSDQRHLYQKFLASCGKAAALSEPQKEHSDYHDTVDSTHGFEGYQEIDMSLKSILNLRMICNHPTLHTSSSALSSDVQPIIETNASGKMKMLHALLTTFYAQHRCARGNVDSRQKQLCVSGLHPEHVVIVSNFTTTLDVVAAMAHQEQWHYLRIDGNTPPDQRQMLVDRFNRAASGDVSSSAGEHAFLFLLSSRAGGVGLNLVGASRLVLFDSDWNPAIDAQAMGRVWRQGQRRSVFTYRFLSTGTVEEKIFQRQIAKGELSTSVQVEDASDSPSATQTRAADVRHFCREELRDLFSFEPDIPICDTYVRMAGKWPIDGTRNALAEDPILQKAVELLHVDGEKEENITRNTLVSYVRLQEIPVDDNDDEDDEILIIPKERKMLHEGLTMEAYGDSKKSNIETSRHSKRAKKTILETALGNSGDEHGDDDEEYEKEEFSNSTD